MHRKPYYTRKWRPSLRRIKARADAGKIISGRDFAVFGLARWFVMDVCELNTDAATLKRKGEDPCPSSHS